jgi:RNA polymerase sigma factor (TIGR02999 family)
MSEGPPRDVTGILRRARAGETEAREELLRIFYDELHRRAAHCMAGQPAAHTLQATALVHETYMRLTAGAEPSWVDRTHFLAAASRAMRHVLVDHARTRKRVKRSPQGEQVPLDHIVVTYEDRSFDLAALDGALEKLAEFDSTMSRAVELRFFGGLTFDETAEVLGLSKRTLERRWQVTRTWLHAEMR